MEHKFKTNINCNNCINAVTPFLNKEIDIERWEVDTENPNKILTVNTDLSADEVVRIVEEAGYKAAKLEQA
ncbi:hypothetical protein GC194_03645 [bacterium]|nr:hypothetical protein [bacterium]